MSEPTRSTAPFGRFNLNLFFALDAILSARNLTDAARASHLSQPAMSVALKKLRAYFKDELVIYAHGGCELTELASLLKPRIKMLLQGARESLELKARFDPATSTQSISIMSSDIVEMLFVSRVLARMARLAPHVHLTSLPAAYKAVEDLFLQQIDVAIISEAFASPQFAMRPLFTDTLSCLVWQGNSEVGATLSDSQYFRLRHAATVHSPELVRHPVGRALGELMSRSPVIVRTSSVATLPQTLVGTELIATTLTRFAVHSARFLPLRVLPLPIAVPPIQFVAQWQHYRSAEPLIEWTLAQLAEAAQDF